MQGSFGGLLVIVDRIVERSAYIVDGCAIEDTSICLCPSSSEAVKGLHPGPRARFPPWQSNSSFILWACLGRSRLRCRGRNLRSLLDY
jgi:hypothetical protein